jgi:hypothetical protein
MAWTGLVCNHKRPPVEFLVDCLVSKHISPVIYYLTGWMLYKASKALMIAKGKRPLYHQFAGVHSIDEDSAKSMSLLTSRSHNYFVFICFIESVYLANLFLKMMMAYTDGDIISQIKQSILANERAKEIFTSLSGLDKCQYLMDYILERYANMRGTFFVRFLKGNSGNQVKKLAESPATRTKVANAVVCAQKIAVEVGGCVDNCDEESSEIQAFWKSATIYILADGDNEIFCSIKE